MPAVLNGTDDKFYPDGWAVSNKAPRTIRTSLEYICLQMQWPVARMRGRQRLEDMNKRREAAALALQRRHANKNLQHLADAMNRDYSSVKAMLRRARYREERDSEFRDLVAELENLI